MKIMSLSIKKPSKSKCGDASFAGEVYVQGGKYTLLLVADGVSSRPKDWLASQSTIDNIINELNNSSLPLTVTFKNAVEFANTQLVIGVDDTMGMLSTLIGVLYSEKEKKLWLVNVGDSRLYGLKNDKYFQLTKDDSKNQLIKMNGDVGSLPVMKSMLSRAIGMTGLNVEVEEMSSEGYNAFVLASDGYYSLSNFEIYTNRIIQESDMAKAAARVKDQIQREITDDASFAILRPAMTAALDLRELIESDKQDISAVPVMNILFYELKSATVNSDLNYQEGILDYMEKRKLFYDKAKMIQLLEFMIAHKSPFVQKLALMIRRL
jgi:protein phosphatase